MKRFFKFFWKHKILSIILLAVIFGIGYWAYGKTKGDNQQTSYTLTAITKGSLISSVSGSGQISASNQVDVKPEVSGKIIGLYVKAGQEVKAGAVLAKLDSSDAYKTVKDAQSSLESAQISLKKLKQPATDYEIMQAENSLTSSKTTLAKLKLSQQTDYSQAKETKQKAEDDLNKAYEDAFNDVASAFLDFPTIITELYDVLYSDEIGNSEPSIGRNQSNTTALVNSMISEKEKAQAFQTLAESDYKTARAKYEANFENYKNATRYSEDVVVEALLNETLETAKAIAQSIKSQSNYLDAWVDYRSRHEQSVFSKITEYQNYLATYNSEANSHVSSLLTTQRTLQTARETILSSDRSIRALVQNQPLDLASAEASVKDKETALIELKADPDELDIQSQELTIKQKQDALADAWSKLADYTITAPFDGIIASCDAKKGDLASSGTIISTLITKQKLAEISLNEVDAAKVKVGQKTTLSFDAVSDLSLTGQTVEIDALGTVSQGVVTYNIIIVFDTQDDRIKPGMSVSASVITEIKQDVLLAPNSAVKSSNGFYYVEVLENFGSAVDGQAIVSEIPPIQKAVEIGSANDSFTEITSGLTEGDLIVSRTTASSASSASAVGGQSILQMGGGGFRPRD